MKMNAIHMKFIFYRSCVMEIGLQRPGIIPQTVLALKGFLLALIVLGYGCQDLFVAGLGPLWHPTGV